VKEKLLFEGANPPMKKKKKKQIYITTEINSRNSIQNHLLPEQ